MENNNENNPIIDAGPFSRQQHSLAEIQAPDSLIPSVLSRIRQASVTIQPTNSPEIDRLLAAIKDTDWHVRATAVRSFGELGEHTPVEPLITALNDEDTTVRAAAVRILRYLPEQARMNHLLEALHDSEWIVREAAALTLGELADHGAYETLQMLANAEREDTQVREAAKLAMKQAHIDTLRLSTSASTKTPMLQASTDLQKRTNSSRVKLIELVRRLPAWKIDNKDWQEEDDTMPLTDSDEIINSTHLSRQDAIRPKTHAVVRVGEAVLAALLIAGLIITWLAFARLPHPSSSVLSSHSRSTPTPTADISSPLIGHDVRLTINNGVVYAGTMNNDIYALRAGNGKLLWRYHTQGSISEAPLVVNGIVYVSANTVVGPGEEYTGIAYALRASDGAVLWRFARNGYTYTPVVVDGVVYIGAWDNTVTALRANDGTPIWHFTTHGPVFDDLSVVNGVVYASSYIEQGPGTVYALKASDGTLHWRFTTQGGVSQATVANGAVYVESAQGLTVLRISNGTPIWHFALGSTGFSTPIVLNGIIYTMALKVSLAETSSSGGGSMARTISSEQITPFTSIAPFKSGVSSVYALRASDGTPLWHYTLNNGKNSWGTLLSIANGVIYAGASVDSGKNSIYALRASNGSLIWQQTSDDAPDSGVVANGILYIGSNSSAVFALRADNGSLLWSYTRIGQVFDTPVLSGNYLYVSALNGIVYVLQTRDGSLQWYYQTDVNG